MNRHSLPFVATLATMACCAGIVACGAVPETPIASEQLDCAELAQQIQRAAAAEREAAQQQRDAWKAVVPFVVVARAANGKAAIAEQQQRQAELQAQAVRQGCADPRL